MKNVELITQNKEEMKTLFEILLTIDGKEEFGKNYVLWSLQMQKKMKTAKLN